MMNKTTTLSILCLLSLALTVYGRDYYVAPTGNDTAAGTRFAPFKTIQKAADIMQAGDTCIVNPGLYRETVTPKNSGTKDKPIMFRAEKKGTVTITGCDVLGDWKRESGETYSAPVESWRSDMAQVFCDEQMMWEARWPNIPGRDAKYLLEFPRADMAPGTMPTRIVDPKLPNHDWRGARVWVACGKRWGSWIVKVTDHGKGFLEIVDKSDKKSVPTGEGKLKGQYYVFGTRAALDVANEWAYDAATQRLYVKAPGGGHPAERVSFKVRERAFDLRGKSNIRLEGLNIHAATIVFDQAASHVSLDGLRILYPGGLAKGRRAAPPGISLLGRSHTIRNCEIAYATGTGIQVGADGFLVVNNFIHDCNTSGSFHAPALDFIDGNRNGLVSHNTITRTGRQCVAIEMYDTLVQYNDLSHAGYLTQDLGLTYGENRDCGNSEFRYNFLHHNVSERHNMGLYFDHGTRNLIVHHNVIWGKTHSAVILNQYAHYVLYYNNTMAGGERSGFRSYWQRLWEHDLHGCVVVNNIADGPFNVFGTGMKGAGNLWDFEGLTSKRRPKPGTGAIDGGLVIAGMTDGYSGRAPDCGAFESDRPQWRVGHDFENPPVDIDTARSLPPHRNLLVNTELFDDMKGWERTDNVSVVRGTWGAKPTNKAHNLLNGARIGAGPGRVGQTVAGLKPGETYELMAMLRVSPGESVVLVAAFGRGAPRQGKPLAEVPERGWVQRVLRFTLGPQDTQVTVYAEKLSSGQDPVYVDEMGLQWIDPRLKPVPISKKKK